MKRRDGSERGVWLVTGGAGYIGAHVVRRIQAAGWRPVVLDDMSAGRVANVPSGVPVVEASVGEIGTVESAIREFKVCGVFHLAGRKSSVESFEDPFLYYRENLCGTVSLLEACSRTDVRNLVLSSSAAVYGDQRSSLVTEDMVPAPMSPYGRSKALCEQVASDAGIYGNLSWISLRYFNVVASEVSAVMAGSSRSLFPAIFSAVESGDEFVVNGTDFSTPDGSAVRDYVHVSDIANAHIVAAEALLGAVGKVGHTYNVGTGRGYSVFEILDAVHRVTGEDIRWKPAERRQGDSASVIAGVDLIRHDLRWSARHDLDRMIQDAWSAWKRDSHKRLGEPGPVRSHA